MPAKKNHSMVKELRRLSLQNADEDLSDGDDVAAQWKARAVSSYQKNYQPLEAGIRTILWAEGFKQREERKKGGFKHFKIEWMCPTTRGKSEDSTPQHSVSPDVDGKAEDLFLLPSKLEKKRIRLQRMYDRKSRKKQKSQTQTDEKLSPTKSAATDRSRIGLSDYEKNRLNNMKSHIVLPTLSTCGSTSRFSAPPTTRRSGSSKKSRSSAKMIQDPSLPPNDKDCIDPGQHKPTSPTKLQHNKSPTKSKPVPRKPTSPTKLHNKSPLKKNPSEIK